MTRHGAAPLGGSSPAGGAWCGNQHATCLRAARAQRPTNVNLAAAGYTRSLNVQCGPKQRHVVCRSDAPAHGSTFQVEVPHKTQLIA